MTITTSAPVLARVDRDGLLWSRTGTFSRDHHLDAGDQRVASLRFLGRFRSGAEAECGNTRWRLEPVSWLSGDVKILDADSGRAVGRYRDRILGGGTLELANGDRFRWRSYGFLMLRWGFVREQGDPLVVFRSRMSFLQTRDQVTVDADARRLAELPLLLVLGRYLSVRRRRRAAA